MTLLGAMPEDQTLTGRPIASAEIMRKKVSPILRAAVLQTANMA
jgi:hypothetical protein